MPGVIVPPFASITVALASIAIASNGPTATMRSPVITIAALLIGGAPVPSMTVPFFTTFVGELVIQNSLF